MELLTSTPLPTYCEHYEPLLVEEIALARHPSTVHYGKCALIGYLRPNVLESLAIPSLPDDLQLPDGATQVALSFGNYYGSIPRNCTVRVFGSVQLKGPPESPLTSSRDLVAYVKGMRADLVAKGEDELEIERTLQTIVEAMARDYSPFVDVQGCEKIERAKELIGCNLRLKRINKKLGPRLDAMAREMFDC
uniref:(northern house mosquito) hypothetical protein n=1 Tax=Culex pipiens TaxID=7175 RepID=A0A8D8B7L2_CULPI